MRDMRIGAVRDTLGQCVCTVFVLAVSWLPFRAAMLRGVDDTVL